MNRNSKKQVATAGKLMWTEFAGTAYVQIDIILVDILKLL